MIIFLFSYLKFFHVLPSLFFFNDTATTEFYPLSLHDALPIYFSRRRAAPCLRRWSQSTEFSSGRTLRCGRSLRLPPLSRAAIKNSAHRQSRPDHLPSGPQIGRAHV